MRGPTLAFESAVNNFVYYFEDRGFKVLKLFWPIIIDNPKTDSVAMQGFHIVLYQACSLILTRLTIAFHIQDMGDRDMILVPPETGNFFLVIITRTTTELKKYYCHC